VVSAAGVLLAAGRATRFRPPGAKLRAPLEGRPLAAWALSALASAQVLEARAVVVGADRLEGLVPAGIEVLVNSAPERGLASSLAIALDWARGLGVDALVVGLADQPLVVASAWDAVACAPVAWDLAIATYAGARANPVRIARRVFDELPRVGDAGARVLVGRAGISVIEVPCEGDPLDVDTVQDLAEATSRMARSESRVEGG